MNVHDRAELLDIVGGVVPREAMPDWWDRSGFAADVLRAIEKAGWQFWREGTYVNSAFQDICRKIAGDLGGRIHSDGGMTCIDVEVQLTDIEFGLIWRMRGEATGEA
jgi:hypothetical protein